MRKSSNYCTHHNYIDQKYSKYIDTEQPTNAKLRELLKLMNKDLDYYINKPKSTSVPASRKIDIQAQEQANNEEIIKRMRYELASTQRRLKLIEEKNYITDLEAQVQKCSENIKQLTLHIHKNKQINVRMGNEIVKLEENNGILPIQQEILQLDKEYNDIIHRNVQLQKKLSMMENSVNQLSEVEVALDVKISNNNSQYQLIAPSNEHLDTYQKLKQQLLNYQRTCRIIDEKHIVDTKMIRQDISNRQYRRVELDNQISNLQMEILQINQQCNQINGKMYRRPQISRQQQEYQSEQEQPIVDYKRSRGISEYTDAKFVDIDRQLSKSFTQQLHDSSDFENGSKHASHTKYTTIIEDQLDKEQSNMQTIHQS